MHLLQAVLTLYLLIDSIGAIAVVASLLKLHDRRSKIKIICRESFFAFCVLIPFAIFGSSVLSAMGISTATLYISSFFVIGLVGMGMLYPKLSPFSVISDESNGKVAREADPSLNSFYFAPIAMPLLVGAGSIGLVSIMSASLGAINALCVVIVSLLLSCGTLLLGCAYLCNKDIILILEKLFGMVIVMLAVESLLTGIQLFVRSL